MKTALIYATFFDKTAIVKLLLKAGVDKAQKDNDNRTALDYATFNKKYKRVFKLNFIEKNIIQLMVQISENPFGTNENIEFKKLHVKIQKKNDLEDSISNKIYTKYIESKLKHN